MKFLCQQKKILHTGRCYHFLPLLKQCCFQTVSWAERISFMSRHELLHWFQDYTQLKSKQTNHKIVIFLWLGMWRHSMIMLNTLVLIVIADPTKISLCREFYRHIEIYAWGKKNTILIMQSVLSYKVGKILVGSVDLCPAKYFISLSIVNTIEFVKVWKLQICLAIFR